jgi:hypothetical protein
LFCRSMGLWYCNEEEEEGEKHPLKVFCTVR